MASTLRNGFYGFDYREEDNRRVAREDRKTYDIKQMWQVHHEIVNLRAQGFKENEIAEILNVTPQTVSNTINSTLGEEKLSVIRQERDEDAKKSVEKIRVLKDKALKVYHEVFDEKDENGNLIQGITMKDKLDLAKHVMNDLSGMKTPTRIQTQSVIMTPSELEEFKQRGLETMRASGLIAVVEEVKEISEPLDEPGQPE
jgi:predicted transcriptional regulator